MKSKTLRIITAFGVVAIITLGFFTPFGIGTLSAPGIYDISILCPLGALMTMLASKLMIPRAVVSLVVIVLLIIIFARAFCAWVCPIPLVSQLRNLFSKRKKEDSSDPVEQSSNQLTPLSEDEKAALSDTCKGTASKGKACSACAKKRGAALDSRHFVLGGALLSTAIFGFPVFCLVCPIGLTFATIVLLIRLFGGGDVTWSLVLVPALLIVEVVLFRKWCHTLCPLSAFTSLISKANKTFVPTIDDTKCLETAKGAHCNLCGQACEEGIDIRHYDQSKTAWNECSKCRACIDACPTGAIKMPFFPSRKKTSSVGAVLKKESASSTVEVENTDTLH